MQVCQTNKPSPLLGDTSKIQQSMTLGKVFIPQKMPNYTVQGAVIDEKRKPIIGASVTIKGTKTGAATNNNGKFSLHYNDFDNEPILKISYLGYAVEEKKVSLKSYDGNIEVGNIVLKPAETMLLGEVVVGGISIVRQVKKANKFIDTLRKIFPRFTTIPKDKLTMAPNPAKPGSTINITFEKAGDYQVQLFNLQSTSLFSQKINIATDNSKTFFSLPIYITKGEYIISAANTKSKAQLSGKLIVQ